MRSLKILNLLLNHGADILSRNVNNESILAFMEKQVSSESDHSHLLNSKEEESNQVYFGLKERRRLLPNSQ